MLRWLFIDQAGATVSKSLKARYLKHCAWPHAATKETMLAAPKQSKDGGMDGHGMRLYRSQIQAISDRRLAYQEFTVLFRLVVREYKYSRDRISQ